jgi:hypothetical protein
VNQWVAQSAGAAQSVEPFELVSTYWPAFKSALIFQFVFGVLTALMLDGGRSFEFFKVAFAGHWIGILIIIGRRPISPTKADIFFIRWGLPVVMLATGLVAPFIWSMIGASHLSGWQRLWD